jgi:hypothetical protein
VPTLKFHEIEGPCLKGEGELRKPRSVPERMRRRRKRECMNFGPAGSSMGSGRFILQQAYVIYLARASQAIEPTKNLELRIFINATQCGSLSSLFSLSLPAFGVGTITSLGVAGKAGMVGWLVGCVRSKVGWWRELG